MALNLYHDTNGKFPFGTRRAGVGQLNLAQGNAPYGPSVYVGLLPFAEQSAIFSRWPWGGDDGYANSPNHDYLRNSPLNLSNQKIPLYVRCPSSPIDKFNGNFAGNQYLPSYVGIQGAVVDPGGDLEAIQRAIAEVGMKPEKILLTHGHIDHAAGAKDLKEKLKVNIEGPHVADRFLLDALEKQGASYGIPAKVVSPDRWLNEGDSVTVGGHAFSILHCPGHSPGSVVLFNRAQSFALVGYGALLFYYDPFLAAVCLVATICYWL